MQQWDVLKSVCGRVWMFDVEINPPYLEAGLVHWQPTETPTIAFETGTHAIVIKVPETLRRIHTAATISFPNEPVEFVLDSLSSR